GLLVKAGSGAATFGTPTSPGVPEAYASCTLTVPFNDTEAIEEAFAAHGERIACVILEPVAGNMGLVPAEPAYLKRLRALTKEAGSLLIFDEVMSGFRVSLGGAQARYGVTPDLTCLGKVIGGGMPVGAYGGPGSIMDYLSPTGAVYQAGTLSGNPLATAAGLATLEVLEEPGVFDSAEARMSRLCDELGNLAQEAGAAVSQGQAGTMAGLFFRKGPVRNFAEAAQSDTERYARFFWGMLKRGVYIAPSQFEVLFHSTAHGEAELDRTLSAAREAFREAV
ncbi:MAG: aminotransferase class III-fold pyridoxal phosphate-dependent enzyme, partial [Candidatus Hydrogenedentota bacterium]